MNVEKLFREIASSPDKRALPVLSFPAVQKLGITVSDMVKSAQYQAQAMEIVAKETDTVAAVSPMDLSIEAEAFGADICFHEDDVPAIVGQLITDENEAQELQIPDLSAGRIPVAVEGVRLAKKTINDKPVLAGMIGPFSLAGRLMDVTEIMYLLYDEPEAVHIVLRKAADFLVNYALAMKSAGADGIVMAEPLAGILSPAMCGEFSTPYVTEIIKAIQDENFAVVYHNCGNSVSKMLPQIFSQGACAYHFGNAVNMHEILKSAPEDVICMGNVDPVAEFANGTPQSIRNATSALMKECGSFKNFIPSSGCDIPAQTSWENIQAFFDAVSE